MSTRDELAGVLADTLNKQFKDMKVAYFLDGSDTTPTDIKDFVSTGSIIGSCSVNKILPLQSTEEVAGLNCCVNDIPILELIGSLKWFFV